MNWLDKVDEDMFTGVASPSHENAVPKLEFETALVLEHTEVIQVRAGSEPQLILLRIAPLIYMPRLWKKVWWRVAARNPKTGNRG